MIVGTVFLLSRSVPFPGLAALPPCLGAALIIVAGAGGETLIGRILSFRPIVFIGMISYSLYLWHWPIIVFQQSDAVFFTGFEPRLEKISLVFLSILLASISWFFVERPMRRGRYRPSKRTLIVLSSATAAVLCFVGAWFFFSGGLPNRFSPEQVKLASILNYDMHNAYRQGSCFIDEGPINTRLAPKCLTIDPMRKNYLLMGDSHAAHLWHGFSSASADVNVLQATASGCLPMLEGKFNDKARCRQIVDSIYGGYLANNRIDRLLLAGRWEIGSLPRLKATLDWAAVQGIPVTLIGPVVEYDAPLPMLLARASMNGASGSVDAHLVKSRQDLDRKMAHFAAEENVRYVSHFDLLCHGQHCRHFDANGNPIVFDRTHLTADGSDIFAEEMVRAELFSE